MMASDEEALLYDLFQKVLDLSRDERQRVYDELNVTPSLRARIEELIAHDRRQADYDRAGDTSPLASFSEPAPAVDGYTLLGELGKGGMGVVHEALDEQLQHRVAIKLLHEQSLDNPRARARFQREIELLASLRHENIVRIHHGNAHERRPYYVMELLTGGTLADRLAKGPLPPREAADLVRRLALAVHHAHLRTIMHRDLKPLNVVFDEMGTPKLTDFGIARRQNEEAKLTQGYEIVGTPNYMAPEQTIGSEAGVTTITDVYGLGAILYHCLTGMAPYDGTTWEVIRQVQSDSPPVDPRVRNPEVPKLLSEICLKCLAKLPDQRYSSAEALAEDLECWQERRPLRHQRTNLLRALGFWVARHRMASLAIVLLSLLIPTVAVSSLLYYLWDRERALKEELQIAYRELDFRQYSNLLKLANDELEDGRHREAYRLLERCPPEFRGWEWHYLQNLNPLRKPVTGHEGEIAWAELSHDGGLLATASFDGTYKLWDVTTLRELFQSEQHRKKVRRLAFSPDDQELAVGIDNGEIWLHSTKNSSTHRILRGHAHEINGLRYDPQGNWLASASLDGTIRIWNPRTAECLRVLDNQGVKLNGLAFAPIARQLYSGDSAGRVTTWDVETGERIESFASDSARVFALHVSPSGDQLVTAGEDRVARLWSSPPPQREREFVGHTADVNDAVVDPFVNQLATASDDGSVRIWDLSTGLEQRRLMGHRGSVQAVRHLRQPKQLISVGFDRAICLWDLGSSSAPPRYETDATRARVARYSPDGKWLAAGCDDAVVRVYSAESGEMFQEFKGHERMVCNVAWNRDNTLASMDATLTVCLWRIGDDAPRQIIPPAITPNPDAELPIPRNSETWTHWDVPSNEQDFLARVSRCVRGLLERVRPLGGLSFSPDGKTLAISRVGGEPQVYRFVDDGQLLPTELKLIGHTAPVLDLCHSPDGRWIATASFDRTVRIWEAGNGRLRATLEGHQNETYRVYFNHSSTLLASISDDNTARVHDVLTGTTLHVLEGHEIDVMAAGFQPNGDRLFTVDARRNLIVWDLETGIDLLFVQGHDSAITLDACWNPSGDWLVLASTGGYLTTLDGRSK